MSSHLTFLEGLFPGLEEEAHALSAMQPAGDGLDADRRMEMPGAPVGDRYFPGSTQTEAEFMNAVIDYAHVCGWLVHHCRPARGAKGWSTPIQGDAGFPDLVLARRGKVIFAELKRKYPHGGQVPDAQARWATALCSDDVRAGRGWTGDEDVKVFLWTPESWPEIERVLR